MTDGTDRDGFDGIREIPDDYECESCGSTDRRDHFDKVGGDLRCPACGSLSVRSVDTETE